MKNKYLTKCLCITLISAMVVSSSMAVCAAEESEAFTSENVAVEAVSAVAETISEVTKVSEEKGTVSEPEVITEASPVQEKQDVVSVTVPDEKKEASPVLTPGDEASSSPTPEGSASPSPTPEGSASPSPTPEGSASPSPTPEGSASPSPTPGGSVSPSPTPGEGEVSPSPTPEGSVSPSPTPGEGEVSPTPTPEGSVSPTPTPGEEEVSPSPTPGEGEVSPTPTPGEGEVSPTPTPGEGEVSPSPMPGEGEVSPTPTPGEGEVSPTPTPGEGTKPSPTPGGSASPTPTPGEGTKPSPTPGGSVSPSPTPGPGNEVITPTPDQGTVDKEETMMPDEEKEPDMVKVQNIMQRLNKLLLGSFTLEDEEEIKSIRAEYNKLTEEEKALVENYHLLISYEAKLEELKSDNLFEDDTDDILIGGELIEPSASIMNKPVLYTNMVSNLHAGKEFYLSSLKTNYQITFSDDFASVMETIEKEHKQKYKVTDNCDKRADGLTSSADTLLARNWQDVLAIYIYEKSKEGHTEFHLNELCKEDLARIFEELNPIVRDKNDITRVTYANRHINYYINTYNISEDDREILKKYVEADCKLLCATVTGAKGFVRQSVGEYVSEERVNVITAAYSLVGKVGYFWGGKSNSLGENPNWGTAEFVSSPGSSSTGTIRAYGLDCSGFVTWAVINGYQSKAMESGIGNGTSQQWVNAHVISEAEAQPGDLVFQHGPQAGANNHVGILCGKTEAGDWIAIHCSSSKNGVTVGEAYGASFRYIRQPSFYPSEQQIAEIESKYGYQGAVMNEVFVDDSLQQLISQTNIGSVQETFQSETAYEQTLNSFMDDVDIAVFEDGIVVDDDDIEVFVSE